MGTEGDDGDSGRLRLGAVRWPVWCLTFLGSDWAGQGDRLGRAGGSDGQGNRTGRGIGDALVEG